MVSHSIPHFLEIQQIYLLSYILTERPSPRHLFDGTLHHWSWTQLNALNKTKLNRSLGYLRRIFTYPFTPNATHAFLIWSFNRWCGVPQGKSSRVSVSTWTWSSSRVCACSSSPQRSTTNIQTRYRLLTAQQPINNQLEAECSRRSVRAASASVVASSIEFLCFVLLLTQTGPKFTHAWLARLKF